MASRLYKQSRGHTFDRRRDPDNDDDDDEKFSLILFQVRKASHAASQLLSHVFSFICHAGSILPKSPAAARH